MKASTLSIYWHDDNKPIYSVSAANKPKDSQTTRLATAGGDNNIRIWQILYEMSLYPVNVKFLATLTKHAQAVNAVRFDPQGDLLASSGDDGAILVWSLSNQTVDDDNEEKWIVKRSFRCGNTDVYDLAWSPDSQYIAAVSMDNMTRIYSVSRGECVCELKDHNLHVQGVCWDPLNEYLATQSADRSVIVYKVREGKASMVNKISKIAGGGSGTVNSTISQQMYHPEQANRFFRRLCFSIDGSLLLTPAGSYKSPSAESATNTVYVFTRAGLAQSPTYHLPGLSKPAVAIAFCPRKFKLCEGEKLLDLPYRMIFAVATVNQVVIYDTQRLQPLGVVSDLHYDVLTDLTWTENAVFVSSVEGNCSIVRIEEGEYYTGS